MSKLLTPEEQAVAAYFDASAETLLNPYGALGPLDTISYMAYEGYWQGEAHKFGKLLLDKQVLSLGTGTAADEVMFREQGINYVGVDISQNVLQASQQRTPKPTVARMSMRSLGFADNSFGGVWIFDSISHVPETHISEVLDEAHRVIKPRGYLYVNTLVGDGAVDEGAMGSVQYWQPKKFVRKLREAGFSLAVSNSDKSVDVSDGYATFIAQTTK